MSERSIENEEQYQKSLAWLVEKAKLLEHPLLNVHDRAKLDKQYDFVSQKVREYNINQLAEIEADILKQVVKEPKDDSIQSPESKSINLSDWLDDE